MNVRFSEGEVRIRLDVEEFRRLAAEGRLERSFRFGADRMDWSLVLGDGAAFERDGMRFAAVFPRGEAEKLAGKLGGVVKKNELGMGISLEGFEVLLEVDCFDRKLKRSGTHGL